MKKATFWIPEHAHVDMTIMAEFLIEQYLEHGKQLIPFMARDLKSGVMRKPK
ncbi:MAG: hypothetical protein P8J14_04850 [Emcibacteraceae bacterium]|nr:hypothetical protein [Emcibacteraceae bacterium]